MLVAGRKMPRRHNDDYYTRRAFFWSLGALASLLLLTHDMHHRPDLGASRAAARVGHVDFTTLLYTPIPVLRWLPLCCILFAATVVGLLSLVITGTSVLVQHGSAALVGTAVVAVVVLGYRQRGGSDILLKWHWKETAASVAA